MQNKSRKLLNGMTYNRCEQRIKYNKYVEEIHSKLINVGLTQARPNDIPLPLIACLLSPF